MTVLNPLTDSDRADHEERALVVRAKAGDHGALEDLVRRHQAWIYNVANPYTGCVFACTHGLTLRLNRVLHHPDDRFAVGWPRDAHPGRTTWSKPSASRPPRIPGRPDAPSPPCLARRRRS